MSNEELHLDGDFTLNIPHFEADFTANEQPDIQADFKIQTGGSTSFANITGDPYDNSALAEALNQKADNSIVETLSETVENNYTELDGKITDESDARTQADADLQSNIDDVADDLSIETDNRQTADADLQDNIDTVDGKIDTHIADKSNPHEVTKTQIGLGNVDNTSDLNKPISTATQTALNGKQNTISDLSEIRTNASNGQSAYNTIQTYGDIVTYDASNFATSIQGQKADTALQPNDDISELNNDAGYITSASLPTVNNSIITFQKNNVTVGDINLNQPNNETINISVPTQASDVNALPDTTTIEDLTTTAQQNALNSGATSTNIGQIATNTSNISSLSNTVTNNYNTLDGRITSEVSTLNTTIGTETTNRQNADNNLQSQIDAIVSSSDVFDIVGTYAELQAYDISTVPVNDIIKVLVDSTHSNAATYYRCVETGGVKSWSYIGSEGAYYTKSETDTLLNGKYDASNPAGYTTNVGTVTSVNNTQPDVNGDVTLTIPTVNDGILTITQNGTSKGTFSANQSTNNTIALTDTTYNAFTGADGANAGSSGLVPAPSATDNDKYLKGDGTWASVSGGSSTDVQINGTSITSGGVANIVTNTAYNASSNKIATMSDLPDSEIFVATYGTTTFNEVWTAYDAGKTVFVKDTTTVSGEVIAVLNYFEFNSALDAHFEFASSILNDGTYYTYTLDQDSIWDEYTEQIPDTSGFEVTSNKVTSISSSSTNAQYPSAKLLYDQLALKQSTSSRTNTITSSSTSTQYPSASAILDLLKTIYPVGSVYLSTNSTCPLSSLFGTWSLVSSGKALWTGTGSNGNTTIAAGLPNIKGKIQGETGTLSGAFTLSSTFSSKNTIGGSSSSPNRGEISFSASSSNSIYSDSVTTVQPPAYVVNVWRRTA